MTKGPAAVFLQQDPLGIILILIFATLGVTIIKLLGEIQIIILKKIKGFFIYILYIFLSLCKILLKIREEFRC